MKSEITLNNFFVFNSTYGPNEGEEHKKILYYYPSTEDIDIQIKNIGLVEAIIQFTGTFKPSLPVNSLHTQKKRQLYFQPEEGTWVVMTLNTPYLETTKDSTTSREYFENDIQDNVYESVLKQSYTMYRLFNSTFESAVDKGGVDALKSKLQKFYNNYLTNVKLANCDILNIFNGIHFLPLDTQNFLNVQCFVNEMECNYPVISQTLFIYNEHVIWCGIEPEEVQTLYQYLKDILIPKYTQIELQGGPIPRNHPITSIYSGHFVDGSGNLKTADSLGKLPKVVLIKKNQPTFYYMLIYRILSASICLFIEDNQEVTQQLLTELEKFMGQRLASIVSKIAEYCAHQNSAISANNSEATPKFIYFNKMNLAYKTTTHLDNNQTGNLSCSRDCVKIMADINARKSTLEYAGDITVKTMNDYWIVGKNSNMREFYVTIQQKDANLKDISAEVKKLSDSQLRGIFFHEL